MLLLKLHQHCLLLQFYLGIRGTGCNGRGFVNDVVRRVCINSSGRTREENTPWCMPQAMLVLNQAQQNGHCPGLNRQLFVRAPHGTHSGRPIDGPRRACVQLLGKLLHCPIQVFLNPARIGPTNALLGCKDRLQTKPQLTLNGRAEQARATQHPAPTHFGKPLRVGLLAMTYKGFPITIPIVMAKYSAITPIAVRVVPEKKDTTISSEVQPGTVFPRKNFP